MSAVESKPAFTVCTWKSSIVSQSFTPATLTIMSSQVLNSYCALSEPSRWRVFFSSWNAFTLIQQVKPRGSQAERNVSLYRLHRQVFTFSDTFTPVPCVHFLEITLTNPCISAPQCFLQVMHYRIKVFFSLSFPQGKKPTLAAGSWRVTPRRVLKVHFSEVCAEAMSERERGRNGEKGSETCVPGNTRKMCLLQCVDVVLTHWVSSCMAY